MCLIISQISESIAESASTGWQNVSDTAAKWMEVGPENDLTELHGPVETRIRRVDESSPSPKPDEISKGPIVL
jgi:hypothetical protein